MVGAGDACYLGDFVIREHLQLALVQPQIPHFIEVVQLLDGLSHLRLGVSEYEHIICEGQQVTPVDHVPELLSGPQGLLQVDVEEHG